MKTETGKLWSAWAELCWARILITVSLLSNTYFSGLICFLFVTSWSGRKVYLSRAVQCILVVVGFTLFEPEGMLQFLFSVFSLAPISKLFPSLCGYGWQLTCCVVKNITPTVCYNVRKSIQWQIRCTSLFKCCLWNCFFNIGQLLIQAYLLTRLSLHHVWLILTPPSPTHTHTHYLCILVILPAPVFRPDVRSCVSIQGLHPSKDPIFAVVKASPSERPC